MATACTHLDQIQVTTTTTQVCQDCIAVGDEWLHLRLCLSCGHVGCCDSSKNRHASRHYLRSGHPLVRSIEPGERWVWCYADNLMPGELPN